jgi:hypothetical protein
MIGTTKLWSDSCPNAPHGANASIIVFRIDRNDKTLGEILFPSELLPQSLCGSILQKPTLLCCRARVPVPSPRHYCRKHKDQPACRACAGASSRLELHPTSVTSLFGPSKQPNVTFHPNPWSCTENQSSPDRQNTLNPKDSGFAAFAFTTPTFLQAYNEPAWRPLN